ncbi:MAG: hypothetical protein ACUVRA_06075 [Candidatus Bathyarchaeaceae archaeon]
MKKVIYPMFFLTLTASMFLTFPLTSLEDSEIQPIPITITIKVPANASDQAMNGTALATTSAEPQPAMFGYMDTENSLRYAVSKVRVRVSFPDTDFSVVQEDNWLAGGMWIRGSDSELDQTDYAFYALLVLYPPLGPNTLLFQGGVYQMYEGLNPVGKDPWIKLLYYDSLAIPVVDISTPFTLTATFNASTGMISWEAQQLWGGYTYTLQPFNITAVCPTICRHFVVGTFNLESWPILYWWVPYGKCYFFLFGASSRYHIGQGGWNVLVSYPSYFKEGVWYFVGVAKSIRGKNAYLDARFTAGGATYEGVNAYYDRYWLRLYYSGSTLGDNTLLWSGCVGGC